MKLKRTLRFKSKFLRLIPKNEILIIIKITKGIIKIFLKKYFFMFVKNKRITNTINLALKIKHQELLDHL